MASMLFVALSACNGPNGEPHSGDTGPEIPIWDAELGPIAVLTSPNGGELHTHATTDWDDGQHFLVTWAVGVEPNTHTLAQRFEADGFDADAVAAGDMLDLTAPGHTADKPDVEWDGARWVVGWNDSKGGVFLDEVAADGSAPHAPVQIHDVDIDADAVDLATYPDGSGVAMWTESGADWMGPDGGRILWQRFTSTLAPDGDPKQADESSKKTSDVAALPDGGFLGVWSRDYDHPVIPGDFYYEVWGRLYRDDGTAWTFRADDLDSAWPSRPAVDVRPDGVFAVSWRDKTDAEGAGLGSGAYGRLFAADATPLGPSIPLGPDHDGDRVVVGWAGDLAIYAWQETDPDGLPGVILSAVDLGSGAVVVDRLPIHEAGGDRDERPSIAIRAVDGGWDVLVVWETYVPGSGDGDGLRARTVHLTPG
jgi:hypothetical protein